MHISSHACLTLLIMRFLPLLVLSLIPITSSFAQFSPAEWELLDPETRALQEADYVRNLPGQPPVTFRHYSGYVTIDEHYGKALFYWFFEATQSPQDKPLLLWLNGGPACSAIAFGEALELGPFLIKEGPKLVLNNNSWNQAANLLFLDSPAGVGFSYANASYPVGDNSTAQESHEFMVNWLKRFPQYKSNEFYIAGESYAGHYVPQLANAILDENSNSRNDTYINLKGIMVGNAALDSESDDRGLIDYAWGHGVISDALYNDMIANCNLRETLQTLKCINLTMEFFSAYNLIDIYSIYSPRCPSGFHPFADLQLLAARALSGKGIFSTWLAGYEPCALDDARVYFNRPDVQEALGANITNISHPWSPCNINLNMNWTDSASSILPVVKKLVDSGIRVWVYSGDTDGRIPVTSTRYTLNKLGLPIAQDWAAWYTERNTWYSEREVGGWSMYYEGLAFVTVRGAGHQVPTFAPVRSLQLVSHFLANQTMPSVPT